MSIRGSLKTFSLPELFQIIGSGRKSGRLKLSPSIKFDVSPSIKFDDLHINATFELWFKRGYFVAITNSYQYQALIEKIQENAWIDSRVLVKNKYLCTADQPFGEYLQEKNLINEVQLESLFNQQIDQVYKLFHIKDGSFKFEEVNQKNKIASDGETFPTKEMTGKQRKVMELSLVAMRDFSDWSRFADDIPQADMGLRKLAKSCKIKLTSLEQYIWSSANGSISLKKLAKQKKVDLKTLQYTALSMIFSGLVEELPVVKSAEQFISNSPEKLRPNLVGVRNTAVKSKAKIKVSNSLINNLVSFLKDNF